MKVEKGDFDDTVVALDTYNSDLNLSIDASRFSGQPLTSGGFALTWAGARSSYGVAKGKVCFEVKVVKHMDVAHLPADEPNPHVVRLGFSVESASMQLGEEPLSYGYGGTGKISTNCQFKDYGVEFMQGDVVMALLNMDTDPVQIGFAKNGKFLGWAWKINKGTLKGQPLFPHVLTKNCTFEVNFGQREKPYFGLSEELKDYTFIGCIPLDLRVHGVMAPERREDCEMIMMCGLPGAGKSVWAADYSQKNPEKKYNVLGTNNIIDKMKVMGLPRKRNYAGRWEVLIQMATKCINKMFEIGSKLRRNYILDQTNVYPTAQRRKMRNFEGFKRIAVVVVPTDVEFRRRINKREREEGKDVPDSAVLEMKANFKLPEVGDIFDEVIFTELQRDEAEKLVQMYNEEGRASVGPPQKRFHGSKDHSPSRPGMQSRGGGGNSFRGRGGNRDRSGPQGGFDGRGRGGGDFGSRGFSGGRGGGGRNEFGDRGDFGGRSFGMGREEFGGSDFGRNEPVGRGDFQARDLGGRADFEGRGIPPGNFRDSADYGDRPGFNDYNRGGQFGSYKGGMGSEYPDSVDVKPGIGGMRDSGAGGYKGRQGDRFGPGPDTDRDIKPFDDKFGSTGSPMGYSGPNTFGTSDGSRGAYGGRAGSQGDNRRGGGSQGWYGGRGGGSGSRGSFSSRGSSDGGYGGRSDSQGGYGSGTYGKESETEAYGSRAGSFGGGYGKDNVQGGTYDKDGSDSYKTDTRGTGGYGQDVYKSSGAGTQGGYGGGYSSRGGQGYGGSGPAQGFDNEQQRSYGTDSPQGGYRSGQDRGFSGGQNNSRAGSEKKRWSQDNVQGSTARADQQQQPSSYSSYTSANASGFTGGSGSAGYASYSDQSQGYGGQSTQQQQWKGATASYSQQGGDQATGYGYQQARGEAQVWSDAPAAGVQQAAQPQGQQQQPWNQYYQQPQQAQYYGGYPPAAAQGYGGTYGAK